MLLYQYRGSISDEDKFQYFVDLLESGSIKFSKPSEFNDPFDCCVTHFGELPDDSLPHAVSDSLNHRMQQVASEILGVFCLTEHPNRMLMWSHYGDQHRSVCVGFDKDELLKNSPKNSEGNPLYSEIKKVNYTRTRPEEGDAEAVFMKSDEWKYEDEYRIVSAAKKGIPMWGPGVWSISTSAIKEIIIGARVERKLQDKIVNAVNAINPK